MQLKTSVFLAEGMVISAALILLTVVVFVFSPMLWTDHWALDAKVPIPTGCQIESKPIGGGNYTVAHCPLWVRYP